MARHLYTGMNRHRKKSTFECSGGAKNAEKNLTINTKNSCFNLASVVTSNRLELSGVVLLWPEPKG
jgi:hypothetical protein